ncbi:hypothetical protein BRYFOR_06848 [Marvinbryantia formatexigens DSM 14469]|uniref:Uncharacterized protein n=1 Tax=Marvinbryantia formatexigens DSM 14469 TaxID=478749 RepID=C6LDZ9_9FIRM|nr:hypothetical protein BRYFOR_06848 [Marvinbryantia formatexigens DSM 14469]
MLKHVSGTMEECIYMGQMTGRERGTIAVIFIGYFLQMIYASGEMREFLLQAGKKEKTMRRNQVFCMHRTVCT